MSRKATTAEEQLEISLKNNSLPTFTSALLINTAIAIILLSIFCILRKWWPRVYQPKKVFWDKQCGYTKPMSKYNGYISYLKPLIKLDEKELLSTIGLDHYLLIRFLYKLFCLFLFLSLIIPTILLPLNYLDQLGIEGLEAFTIANLKDKVRFWAHLVAIYTIGVSTLTLIIKEYKYVLNLRNEQLLKQDNKNRMSRILVCNLNKENNSYIMINNVFSQLLGGIDKILPYKNILELKKVIQSKNKLISDIETLFLKFIMNNINADEQQGFEIEIKNKSSLSNKDFKFYLQDINEEPDAVCFQKFSKFVKKVEKLRMRLRILEDTIIRLKKKHLLAPMNNACFIHFNSPLAAHIASNILAFEPGVYVYSQIEYKDIIYENINLNFIQKKIRMVLFNSLVVVLIIFWAIPITLITGLSNIDSILKIFPFLEFIKSLPTWIIAVIQAIIPAALINLLMQLLLKILILSATYSGQLTFTDIQLKIMDRYFWFLLINVLFVVTLANGILNSIVPILKDPSSTLTILATSIPKVSTFFITFVLYQALVTMSIDLLAPISLFFKRLKLNKLYCFLPSKFNQAPYTSDVIWGWMLPNYTLMVTIGLTYAVISPIILYFIMLYFFLGFIMQHYNIVNIKYPLRYKESNGKYYFKALKQTIVSLYIYLFINFAIYLINKEIAEAVLILILLVGTISAHVYINFYFYKVIETVPFNKLLKNYNVPEINSSNNCVSHMLNPIIGTTEDPLFDLNLNLNTLPLHEDTITLPNLLNVKVDYALFSLIKSLIMNFNNDGIEFEISDTCAVKLVNNRWIRRQIGDE